MKKLLARKIIGQRIILRPVGLENILKSTRNIVRRVRDPEVKNSLRFFSFFQGSLGPSRQMQFFFRMLDSENDQIFVIETKSGEFLGTCGVHDIDWANDALRLGIIIFNKNYWRQGYGKEVIDLLLNFAFYVLKMNRVYLGPRVDNELAIHIYKKLGFTAEGVIRQGYKVKKDEYIDLLQMSILKSERSKQ